MVGKLLINCLSGSHLYSPNVIFVKSIYEGQTAPKTEDGASVGVVG